jgi:hypothetical protein
MRWKKQTNLNSDPSSKTRACTNDDENVTARQETRDGTVRMGKNADRDVGWDIVGTRTRRGGMLEVPTSKTKTLASIRQLPVQKHEVEETNLE